MMQRRVVEGGQSASRARGGKQEVVGPSRVVARFCGAAAALVATVAALATGNYLASRGPCPSGSASFLDLAPATLRSVRRPISARPGRSDRQLQRRVPNDEVGQMLQRVVEVGLLEWRELEVLAHLGLDR